MMRALLFVFVVGACGGSHPPAAPPRDDFGFYLLAMMWTPSSCCTGPASGSCANAPAALTLHGLWPNFTDEQSRGRARAWPQFCGGYAHCEQAEAPSCAPGVAVPTELAALAPGYVADHGGLATHEWSKHGSCTTLSAGDYFAAELAAIRLLPSDATPDALRAAAGRDLARSELQRAFGVPPESVVLGCDPHCRLTQVGFCLAKDAHDHPTAPIACTANVATSEYDNGCVTRGCERVSIPAPGACGTP